MKSNYDATNYLRFAQRFTYPLYVKDEIGGYNFSSTITFIKYEQEYISIFAAHALGNKQSINNIGLLYTDGTFVPLNDITRNYEIYKQHDLVICINNEPFSLKNYFNLNINISSTFFHKLDFFWLGYPIKKAESYHRTKATPEKIKEKLSTLDDGVLKWDNARFLLANIKFESETNDRLIGSFDNENVSYKQEGFKQKGYALRGMSGGPLFYFSRRILNKIFEDGDLPLNEIMVDDFLFAGIGLEYDGKMIVKGASSKLILFLIKELLG